jgi:hypothetical protein
MTAKNPLFNPETVKNLGKDSFCDLAELYLKQAPEKLAQLETSLQRRRFKALANTAQELGYAAGHLGAEHLADSFLRVEEAARAKDLENLLRLLPAANQAFRAVSAELKKQTQEKQAA